MGSGKKEARTRGKVRLIGVLRFLFGFQVCLRATSGASAYDLAKLRGGRCVLFGVMPSDQRVSIHTLPLHFGRVLTGSEGGQSQPDKDIPEILGVLAGNKIDWRSFISRRGRLADLDQIISQMRSGEVIHAIVT